MSSSVACTRCSVSHVHALTCAVSSMPRKGAASLVFCRPQQGTVSAASAGVLAVGASSMQVQEHVVKAGVCYAALGVSA